jgi:hypothetical protein
VNINPKYFANNVAKSKYLTKRQLKTQIYVKKGKILVDLNRDRRIAQIFSNIPKKNANEKNRRLSKVDCDPIAQKSQ